MATPPLAVRRLLLAPLIVVLELVLVLASPLVLVAAVLLSPAFGGWRPVRMAVIVLSFVLRHLAACAACARLCLPAGLRRGAHRERLEPALYGVLRSFVDGVYGVIVRAARVEVRVHNSAAAEEILSSPGPPVVVLSRHAGEGDTLPIWTGRDTILARDGNDERVSCGTGEDSAVLDPGDITLNYLQDLCEHVDRGAGG
ncbi:MAG: hypothetical protein KY433_06995, partial [Actinobacteria bacterium]|nr:hypothetical protein [Actinomycetota bacterium]